MKNMKRTLILWLLLFFIMGLSKSCKPVFKVQSEQLSEISLTKYKSFKFFNPENLPEANFAFSPQNKKLLFEEVASELRQRGLTSVPDADLIVKIQGGTSMETQRSNQTYRGYYDPMNYPFYSSYPYYWGDRAWLEDDISKKVTTILIDILDSETKTLLWQGVGIGVLGEKPEEVKVKLESAIQQIFEKLPLARIPSE
jgi:hypothetical protein